MLGLKEIFQTFRKKNYFLAQDIFPEKRKNNCAKRECGKINKRQKRLHPQLHLSGY